jgi:hypothetical protein
MKTSFVKISRVYRDHLRDDKPDARGACPSIERMAQCVLVDVPRKERAEIVGHAANCAVCASALRDLLDTAAETDRVAAEINRFARREQAGESRRTRAFWSRLIEKPAVAAMAGIFVLAVLTFSVFRLLDKSGTRGGPPARILLVSPVAGSLSRDRLEFRWENLTGTEYYIVELFDRSLKLVWRSGQISGNEVLLADGVANGLTVGETYYWMVTAVTSDRSEIKSRLVEFSVKE